MNAIPFQPKGDRPTPAGLRFFFAVVFPLIFLGAGAVLLVIGARGYLRATASLDWPIAEGVVVASSVRSQTSRSKEGRTSTSHRAEVLYEFEAEGAKWSGARVSFGEYASSDPAHARGIVARYPVGERVAVRHDPDDPGLCVLEPGLGAGVWIFLGLGSVFAVVGLVAALSLPRAMRLIDAPVPVVPPSGRGPVRDKLL
jgi:hypothetical protein